MKYSPGGSKQLANSRELQEKLKLLNQLQQHKEALSKD